MIVTNLEGRIQRLLLQFENSKISGVNFCVSDAQNML